MRELVTAPQPLAGAVVGVVALIGMLALGTVGLVAASLAAAAGLALGDEVLPWLMPVLGRLIRRQTPRPRDLDSAAGAPLRRPGYRLTENGRGPIPAH